MALRRPTRTRRVLCRRPYQYVQRALDRPSPYALQLLARICLNSTPPARTGNAISSDLLLRFLLIDYVHLNPLGPA